MPARLRNPALLLPDAMTGIQNIYKAIYSGGAPEAILELVHLRASQINGCSACVHAAVTSAVTDRIWAEVSHHYNESQLAVLVLMIATTNFFNPINTTIKEPAGATWA